MYLKQTQKNLEEQLGKVKAKISAIEKSTIGCKHAKVVKDYLRKYYHHELDETPDVWTVYIYATGINDRFKDWWPIITQKTIESAIAELDIILPALQELREKLETEQQDKIFEQGKESAE